MQYRKKTKEDLIEELKTLQKKTERAERITEKILESSENAIVIFEDSKVVQCNELTLKFFCKTEKELLGKNIFSFSPKQQPDGIISRDKSTAFIETAMRGEKQLFDWQFSKKENQIFYTRTRLEPFTFGDKTFLTVRIKDLSQRKSTLKSIRENESKFKSLADNAPVLLRMTTPNNYFYYFSKQWLNFTGKTEKEEEENGWIENIFPEEIDNVLSQIDLAFKKRRKYEITYRLKRHDGIYRWMQDIGIPHHDNEGRFAGYISAATDISDRKLLEEEKSKRAALAASEKRLQKSLQKADILAITVDTEGKITFCNDSVCKLTGSEREEIISKDLFDIIIPLEVNPSFQKIIESGGFSNNLKTYIITSTGELIDVNFNSIILNNEKGQISGMTIIGEDVSKQIKVQSVLDKANSQLKDIFDNSSDLIQVFDHRGEFLLVNEAWKQKLEYNDEEIKEIKFTDILHPAYRATTVEYFKLIAQGKSFEKIETVVVSKSGQSIYLTGSVNCSKIGEFELEYRGIFHDVTEKVRAEKAQNLYFSITNASIHSKNLSELFKNIHDELSKVIPITNFYISLYDDDEYISFPYFVDEKFKLNTKKGLRKTGKNFTEYAINQSRPLLLRKSEIKTLIADKVINNIGEIPNVWMCAPLKLEDKHIGLVSIKAYDETITYDEKDIALLDFISGQIALAIERKRSEIVLLNSEKKFRDIFESIQDIYFRCKINGDITMVSPSIKDFMGYGANEVVGKNITNHYLYSPKIKNLIRKLAKKKNIRDFEVSVVTKEGGILQCISNIRLVYNEKNIPVEIEGVAKDISLIKETNQALIESKELAEHTLKVKENFLANMSHEIRTPMNGVIGMIDLLDSTTLTNEQKEYVLTIKKSSETLLSILNGILDLSKIEAGKMQLTPTVINLGETLDKLYALFAQQALSKNINLFYHIDSKIPEYLEVDEIRLLQIFSNLLSNAIKFTKGGGAINLDLKLNPNSKKKFLIKAEVRDSGIGITKEEIDKLFTNFSQLDNSSTKEFGGTGLGLSISKELAQLMGGEIGVFSSPGFGSTFWFSFEALKSDKKAFEAANKSHDMPGISKQFTSYSPSVLVVDDNKINRQVASQILRKSGCNVDTANSGKEAIKLVKQKDYEVIFMDIQMPEMDGVEVTTRLKKLKSKKLPPIVAMTAYSMQEDREKYINAGLDDYIPKPLKGHVLISKVVELTAESLSIQTPNIAEHTNIKRDSDKPKSIEIIDTEIILQLAKYGGFNTVKHVYDDFLSETDVFLEKLSECLVTQKYKDILSILHTIKGNAGTLGVQKIHLLTADIESKLKIKDYRDTAINIKKLSSLFYEYKSNYKEIINSITTYQQS